MVSPRGALANIPPHRGLSIGAPGRAAPLRGRPPVPGESEGGAGSAGQPGQGCWAGRLRLSGVGAGGAEGPAGLRGRRVSGSEAGGAEGGWGAEGPAGLRGSGAQAVGAAGGPSDGRCWREPSRPARLLRRRGTGLDTEAGFVRVYTQIYIFVSV